MHRNVPGVMLRINEAFSRHALNVSAQYLQTSGDIGYVVLDAEGSQEQGLAALADLRAIDGTIRARLLY